MIFCYNSPSKTIKIGKIKKIDNKCWWEWRAIRSLVHHWWECEMQFFRNSLAVVKHILAIWLGISTLGYVLKRIENRCLNKYWYFIAVQYLYLYFITVLFKITKGGNNPDIHQMMGKKTKCDIST